MKIGPFTVDVDAIAAGMLEMIEDHPDGACLALGMLPAEIMLTLERALEVKIPDEYFTLTTGKVRKNLIPVDRREAELFYELDEPVYGWAEMDETLVEIKSLDMLEAYPDRFILHYRAAECRQTDGAEIRNKIGHAVTVAILRQATEQGKCVV